MGKPIMPSGGIDNRWRSTTILPIPLACPSRQQKYLKRYSDISVNHGKPKITAPPGLRQPIAACHGGPNIITVCYDCPNLFHITYHISISAVIEQQTIAQPYYQYSLGIFHGSVERKKGEQKGLLHQHHLHQHLCTRYRSLGTLNVLLNVIQNVPVFIVICIVFNLSEQQCVLQCSSSYLN